MSEEWTNMDNLTNEPAQTNKQPWSSENPWGAPGQQPPAQPPKPKKTGARLVALALCFSLLGSVLGAGGVLLASHFTSGKTEPVDKENLSLMLQGQRANSVIETVNVDTSRQMTAAEVYAANVNSTVGITTSITTNFWGYQSTAAAAGSGFIISNDGYILTNYHVIEDSSSITITLYNGETYDGKIVGYDESNDIAVLKIDAENLTPVVLGDSDNLNVGDQVVAIGNPLGELTFSLTAGTISAKDREVTLSGNITMNLLQTDCAINSGNSGGALFNLCGEVIGVTNAKYSSSSSTQASIDNIGFAIPINHIRSIVESIIEKGYLSKPYIGVSVTDVSAESRFYGLPQGAAVRAVAEGGPAEKAGVQTGDIILAVNGTEITGSTALVKQISAVQIGSTLNLTVYRQGETLEVTVTVEEKIQSALANENSTQAQQSSQRIFGRS